jgi:hypothetical protein
MGVYARIEAKLDHLLNDNWYRYDILNNDYEGNIWLNVHMHDGTQKSVLI